MTVDQPVTSTQGHVELAYMQVANTSNAEMQEQIIGTITSIQIRK